MAQPDATTLTKVVSVPLSVVVPQAQENGPQADDGTLSLPCGTDLPFRTIQPDDVDALLRFHERLGERTIYFRFFGSMKELSKEKAKYLATVDG